MPKSSVAPAAIEVALAVQEEIAQRLEQAAARRQTQLERARFEAELARRGRRAPVDRALQAMPDVTRRAMKLPMAGCVELHIEQGPVLLDLDLPLGAVLGTVGVERHAITFHGQAAHSGSTPMNRRKVE